MIYWLKINDKETEKLKIVKPFALIANGRISTVYETISGVNAILQYDA